MVTAMEHQLFCGDNNSHHVFDDLLLDKSVSIYEIVPMPLPQPKEVSSRLKRD